MIVVALVTLPLPATASGAATAAPLPATAATPAAAADDPPCGLALNGVDVTGATSPDRAVEIPLDQVDVVNLVAAAPLGTPVEVRAYLGPASIQLGRPFVAGANGWAGRTDVTQAGQLGVGLYRIHVDAGPCSGSVWVRLTGRNPLTTLLGVTGLCLVLAGLALVVFAFAASFRGRRRLLIGAIGGAVLGLGINVLTQQLGSAPVTGESLVLWTVVPGALTAGISAGGARLARQRGGSAPQPPTEQPQQPHRPAEREERDHYPPPTPAPPKSSRGFPWPTRRSQPPPPPAPPTRPSPRTPPARIPPTPEPEPEPEPAPTPPEFDDTVEEPQIAGSWPPPGPPPVPQPAPLPEPRFLQGRVLSLRNSAVPAAVTTAIAPEVLHRVDIEVGPARQEAGWLSGPRFAELLPRDGRSHTVDVVVTEPQLFAAPVRGSIEVPPSGRSSTFEFYLTADSSMTGIEARITLLHRGRVLQTAVLRAPVAATPRPDDQIVLGLEAVLRTELADLDSRTDFGASLVFNHRGDDSAAVTQIVGGHASYLTLTAGLLGIVKDLRADLETVTANSAAAQSLEAPETVALLRLLARKGVLLREELSLGQGVEGQLLDQRRLQVLTVRAESFVPLEFVYDFAPPAKDATLCPDAVESLRAGHCPTCAARKDFPSPVVCPAGFWSVNRVIERQAARPADLRSRGLDEHADLALLAQPTTDNHRLMRAKAGLFAFHERVDALKNKASATVLAALSDVTSSHAVSALTWDAWRDDIAVHDPTLLVLLPHQLVAESEPTLEIAADQQLPRSFLNRALVAAGDEPPVVLLLGCETALADVDFENFVIGFLRYGAAVVIGTVATVLGYQAAPVAAALVRRLSEASAAPSETSFGEVIRAARAGLLADGHVMALSLTAYGDSDWHVGGKG
jgi:hypothetical protein